jgi:hypothetical protein
VDSPAHEKKIARSKLFIKSICPKLRLLIVVPKREKYKMITL